MSLTVATRSVSVTVQEENRLLVRVDSVRRVDVQRAVIVTSGLDAHYTHDQASPNTVWSIIHNLGKKPSVMVVDTSDQIVYGFVQYLDNNTLQITFSAPFAGKAYLN